MSKSRKNMIFYIQCGLVLHLIHRERRALCVSNIIRSCTLQRNKVRMVFFADRLVGNVNIVFTEFTLCIMTLMIIKQCVGS